MSDANEQGPQQISRLSDSREYVLKLMYALHGNDFTEEDVAAEIETLQTLNASIDKLNEEISLARPQKGAKKRMKAS